MKKSTFFFFLFITGLLQAQDTVSVYFDFGISKIRDDQFEVLNSIPVYYDLSDLDSVHFLGMADSIGGIDSNIKLSEKRARNVAKYCQNLFPPNISFRISALGEKTIAERAKNRRVDIILYYRMPEIVPNDSTPVDSILDSIIIEEPCYYVSYDLLNRSHIRTIEKRNKKMVMIELEYKPGRKPGYYYSTVSNTGEFQTNKVTWATTRTGKLWWTKTRYVATIPKESYDQHKIFTIEDPPCDSCNEYFQSKPVITKGYSCMKTDEFLMHNLQYKTKLFNKKNVTIRVPREYVNIETAYYLNGDTTKQIKWETKSGKKDQNYYFLKLPLRGNYLSNISRKMVCCDRPHGGIYSPGICVLLPVSSFWLLAETGDQYQQITHTPYISLGIAKEKEFSRSSLFIGTDSDLSLYASIRFQIHFLSFPLNPVSTWTTPTTDGVYKRFWRFYLGTEVKTKIDDKEPDHLEQNIHIGLASVNYKPSGTIPRIFLQYGYGFDYLQNYRTKYYPIIHLGVNFYVKFQ